MLRGPQSLGVAERFHVHPAAFDVAIASLGITAAAVFVVVIVLLHSTTGRGSTCIIRTILEESIMIHM